LSLYKSIRKRVKKLPIVRGIVAEHTALRAACGFVAPGHFFSPIPDWSEVRRNADNIFRTDIREIPGVNLNEGEQLKLLHELSAYYGDLPFRAKRSAGLRYYFDNPAYSYSDAIFLHCMVRHLKPRRIVEIGSGFSSCVTLDTNELFFGNSIDTIFIEPFPDLLLSLLKDGDRERINIIPKRLQDIEIDLFRQLQAGDILFVDSTHVSRIDSDVNRVFFEILPLLAPGVYVHFHDIFFPFEYPREWLFEGRAWNEIYLLRAFLQYNNAFSIAIMNTFLERFHEAIFRDKMPLCLQNPGGSIWLRKH
jgi:hypothetical protein